MLPSIFVRFKTGLVYTALLSTMVIAGCTMPEQQGQPTSQPQDNISAEINRYQAIIDAAHNHPSLDVIRAYIALEPHAANEAARQKNIDDTWQALTHLSPQQLNELVINANEYTLQGWLDLLSTYQTNKQDRNKLRSAVDDWRIRYSSNPAAHSLPSALQQVQLEPKDNRVTFGLFLPLNGQAKKFGEAIRQGFLDAQKGLPKPSLPVNVAEPNTGNPSSIANPNGVGPSNTAASATVNSGEANPEIAAMPDSAPTEEETTPATLAPASTSATMNDAPVTVEDIKIYDTTSQPLANLLAQAEQDGVTLVVGPLLKQNVEELAQIETPLNVLALNKLDVAQMRPNVCYFSLSPEDEVKSAAMHIWQQQKRNPLVLIPRTEFGRRIAKTFADEWQKLGGQSVLQQTFGTLGEMRQSMNRGVGIRLSGTPVSVSASLSNTSMTQNNTNEPVISTSSTSSIKGAVDAVYIVATADELTTIKPMIDMAINSRKKPALYASSRGNKSGTGPDFRLEMDGMQFSDIPLLTGMNVPLMQHAAKKFANDYNLMRLYAMGIDAWSLANQFAQKQFSQEQKYAGFRLNGATGELSVTDNCIILRQLPWMQFNKGRIELEGSADKTNDTDSAKNSDDVNNFADDNTVQ
ncbi:penicillin-binding protein activator [Xenorhabdus hominickii]|nr:penicillin-binding protein activator [Xenorhabdus hominickii]PHM58174.1 penicillin-binding protein activator LpoA [Xenorhabdus hominickii]